MPYRDLLDVIQALQGYQDISRIDAIGAGLKRSVWKLFDEAHLPTAPPLTVEENTARLNRFSQSTQCLDLRQGQVESPEER